MPEQLPLFKLVIDEQAKADGMDYMGLVDYPAHGKGWLAFGKQKKLPVQKQEFKQHFNEEKRIVTGVAIATNLQIYRRREDGSEYNVFFTKDDTLEIAQLLFENGYMHNVNEMHDLNKDVDDMYLFESYFVNDDRSNIPAAFADQNLQPGTWIVSYKVKNDEVWEKIKEGDFAGFSIEGWFKEVEVQIKKDSMKKAFITISEVSKWDIEIFENDIQIGTELHYSWEGQQEGQVMSGEYLWDGHKIQVDSDGIVVMIDGETEGVTLKSEKENKKPKMKKGKLWQLLFGTTDENKEPIKFDSENKDKYASAVTVDGETVLWDGELEIGIPLFVEVEGEDEPILTSAREYSWEMDGVLMVVTVDEAGLITDIAEAEDNEEEMAEVLQEMQKRFNKQVENLEADYKEKFETVAKEVDELREAVEQLGEEKDDKHVQGAKKPGWQKKSRK